MAKDFHPGQGRGWRWTNSEEYILYAVPDLITALRAIEDISWDDGEQRRARRNGRDHARAIRAQVSPSLCFLYW